MSKKTVGFSLIIVVAAVLSVIWINSSLYAISTDCWCHIDVINYCEDYCRRNNTICTGWLKTSSTCIWESCSQHWILYCENKKTTKAGGMVENCWSCKEPDNGPEPDDGDGGGGET